MTEVIYCLYENWHRSRARVHREGCGHINWPRVIGGHPDTEFDRWTDLGIFEHPNDAIDLAERLTNDQYEDFGSCQLCLPGYRRSAALP